VHRHNRLKATIAWALLAFLQATAAWAQTSLSAAAGQETAQANTPPGAAGISILSARSSGSIPSTTSTPATPVSDLAKEVEELKRIVQQQQQQIRELQTQRGAPSLVPAAQILLPRAIETGGINEQESSKQQQPDLISGSLGALPQANQNSGSSDERVRNLEQRIKGLGPISFSGDIRLRAEPFFGGPDDQSQQRARMRFRARLNAVADLSKEFQAGLSIASGDISDPISTNQDITGFYSRKPFAIDQAFLEYKPKWFKQADFVGGKFRYPWYNTELTWDKDLNPEGAAQTLAFAINTPVLKRIAFVGFELPFAEVAGVQATDKRIVQDITYGGQVQTTWQILPKVQLSAYSGFYDYRGADSIAFGQAKASLKNPQTPFSGVVPLANPGPQSTVTITANNVITVGANRIPTGVSSVTNSQFASRFGLFDNIARLDIDTGNAKVPVTFIGDYVQNTEACANLGKLAPLPANTATTTFVRTVSAPCDSHARRAYWAEGRVGRLQQKGDWQAGYTRIYIEREAVLGGFNYSELRQSTNVSEHRFDVFYQANKSVQLGFTSLVGRPLASSENWLTRLQFDAIYIF